MKKVCLSWIGDNDLTCFSKGIDDGGMFIALLKSKFFREIDEWHILYNKNSGETKEKGRYFKHIKGHFFGEKKVFVHEFDITSNSYRQIFKSSSNIIEKVKNENSDKINLCYHISSGTPEMVAVWVVLSKTKYPGLLYMTYLDKKDGAIKSKVTDIPFDVDETYIQYLEKKSDMELFKMWTDIPEYKTIIHKSEIVRLVLNKAFKVAPHDIPVLILGETGTGKELFARAIHKSSNRVKMPFVTINCSAIQETTANATLFGWSNGAWTGSRGEGKGYFVECDGGTLFLDEIGDLSLETQIKLLRALQYGEVQRVGDGKTFHSDVRIIAATNRDLRKMVAEGKFREDLYYRINVAVLKLPPLRDRGSDSILIADHFLEEINKKFTAAGKKNLAGKFSESAQEFIKNYKWPGNIRELYHTIQRACVWNETEMITEDELREHLIEPLSSEPGIEIKIAKNNPIDLEEMTNQFRRKYIVAALELTNNNMTEAAKILKYKSYQTLTNIMKKSGIERKTRKVIVY